MANQAQQPAQVSSVTPPAPLFSAPAIEPLDPVRAEVLAERAHRILDGGTPRPDSRYQRRELVLHVISAYEAQEAERLLRNAQALQQDYLLRQKLEKEWYFDDLRAQSELGGTADEFVYSYVLPVHSDLYERDFVDLPAEFLTLKRYGNLPGEGVADVQPLTRKDRLTARFVPLVGGQDGLLAGLFKDGLGGVYTWQRRGARVLLDRDPGLARVKDRFPSLELLLVLRRRKTDELPAPPLVQAAQDFDILARVLKLALKKVPEDKVDDNNATVQ